jgi:hypothetical protein
LYNVYPVPFRISSCILHIGTALYVYPVLFYISSTAPYNKV